MPENVVWKAHIDTGFLQFILFTYTTTCLWSSCVNLEIQIYVLQVEVNPKFQIQASLAENLVQEIWNTF